MESKEYFEKVMQDYNQNRKGRSLRKYCKDEAVDYDWLIQYKKNYPLQEKQQGKRPKTNLVIWRRWCNFVASNFKRK